MHEDIVLYVRSTLGQLPANLKIKRISTKRRHCKHFEGLLFQELALFQFNKTKIPFQEFLSKFSRPTGLFLDLLVCLIFFWAIFYNHKFLPDQIQQ